MPYRPFRILAVLLLCVLGSAAARADRPYTVDDMLALESVGTVRFDPSGRRLLFERYGRFDRQSDFGRSYFPGELRSKIYTADLTAEEPPALLFPQADADGFTIAGISPDGDLVAVHRLSEAGLASAVVPLAGGVPTQFDFSPAYNPAHHYPWIGRNVVLAAGPPGEVSEFAAVGRERVEALVALWRERNRGQRPTAMAIGSGRFESFPAPDGALVVAAPGSPRVRSLASGSFSVWHASADGSALAALREERRGLRADRALEPGGTEVARRLLILDPRGGGRAPVEPCPGCDVLNGSLNWSAVAPVLSYVARAPEDEASAAGLRIYDHRTGRSRAVEVAGLRLRSGNAAQPASAWLGDRLAVLAEPAAPAGATGESRPDWYLVGHGEPVKLTRDFDGAAPELTGIGRASLLLLHGGDLWRVDAAGNRHNLTAGIAEPVGAWQDPGDYVALEAGNRQPSDTIIVEIASDHSGQPARLLFVEVETGRIDPVAAPSSSARFVAASAGARRAAVAERNGNVTTLTVIGADGSRRELARLNEHLRGVVGGRPVRIDHKGPDGDDRMSWIMLPPGFRPGQPVPTVVSVYPGWAGEERWSRWELDDAHALNEHILAARGYAVLYPSLPTRFDQMPRDPLAGLDGEVLAAVDAAIAGGYADRTRLAVQGQSYGGYATGALIGMTDRFRSAIGMAGLYDLISAYGLFDVRGRLDVSRSGLDFFGASLMETGMAGLGAPPWVDPQRYLRNSPLMLVANVDTPILLLTGDQDYVSTTQSEEYFTALTRLGKDALMVRYFGEDHVYNSPANIRDMWRRIFEWYDGTLAAAEAPTPRR